MFAFLIAVCSSRGFSRAFAVFTAVTSFFDDAADTDEVAAQF